jgi:pectate lyase
LRVTAQAFPPKSGLAVFCEAFSDWHYLHGAFLVKRPAYLVKLLLAMAAVSACSPSQGGDGEPRRKKKGLTAQAIEKESQSSGDAQLAFPGAVGHGAHARGGRGGKIMPVTTLADDGPGSLRECLEAEGPRVCVFRVSGVIRFTRRPPRITNPFLTIAGQTAPGDGITLAHAGGSVGRTPLLIKNTHDIVVRHIRVRTDLTGTERGSEDAFTIENSARVILDHVSGSWARDELVNGYADNDWITISNSIFAYGIPKHDKCALMASDPANAQHFSFIGNLCAHNGDRNPDINFPPASCVEVLNNVFYNAESEFAEIWETYGGTPVSIAGNVFKAGPDTQRSATGIIRQHIGSKGPASIYLYDNAFDGDFVHVGASAQGIQQQGPTCPLTMMPASAQSAYNTVLARAGTWPRDAIDAQVVSEVRSRTGKIVRVPGAIPAFSKAIPYPDSDNDGMDDRWEQANGGNAAVYDPWDDTDRNGINNFDSFLEHLDKERGL